VGTVGQPDSFEAFVGAVTPRLRRSANLLTGDTALAEDLVQTALMKVFMRWGRSGGWASPAAYAQRILYTTFYAWSGRRWNVEVSTGHLPEHAGPDELTDSDTGRVHTALMSLPRRQRAVLVARFFDDLSVEQTADLLGTSPSNVKSHTARGLAKLRLALPSSESLKEDR